MTQEELAEKLNVSSKTISKWETGTSIPDIVMLDSIAKYFKISFHDLLDLCLSEESSIESEINLRMKKYTRAVKKKMIFITLLIASIYSGIYYCLKLYYTPHVTLYLRLPCFTTLASYVSTLPASIATALSHTSDTACAEPRFCATSICPKATHACASDTQEPDSHSTTSCRKTCPYPITTCSQRPLRRSLYATPTSSSLKLISTAKKTYNRQRRASQSLEATPWHGSVR